MPRGLTAEDSIMVESAMTSARRDRAEGPVIEIRLWAILAVLDGSGTALAPLVHPGATYVPVAYPAKTILAQTLRLLRCSVFHARRRRLRCNGLNTPMSPSPALKELEYALLPVEESLYGRRRFRGAKKSSRPELLSMD